MHLRGARMQRLRGAGRLYPGKGQWPQGETSAPPGTAPLPAPTWRARGGPGRRAGLTAREGAGRDGSVPVGCPAPDRRPRTHGQQHRVCGGLEGARPALHGQGQVASRREVPQDQGGLGPGPGLPGTGAQPLESCAWQASCPRGPLAQARLTTALPGPHGHQQLRGATGAAGGEQATSDPQAGPGLQAGGGPPGGPAHRPPPPPHPQPLTGPAGGTGRHRTEGPGLRDHLHSYSVPESEPRSWRHPPGPRRGLECTRRLTGTGSPGSRPGPLCRGPRMPGARWRLLTWVIASLRAGRGGPAGRVGRGRREV